MRIEDARLLVDEALSAHFPVDVAKAIREDAGPYANVIATIAYAETRATPEHARAVLKYVGDHLDDRTADWLAGSDGAPTAADQPAAWLHKQVNQAWLVA